MENSEGKRTTPSFVSFTKNGIVVGEAAKRLQSLHSLTTVSAVKRLIGVKYNQLTEQQKKMNSFKIIPGPNNDAWVSINNKSYSPSQISSFILSKLKKDSEMRLNKKIDSAVITCPAYFNDAQRQATKDAGRIAGFNVKRIINEPTAAALAYGLKADKSNEGRVVAVYDLGGGTFDISILEISKGIFQVRATNGDTFLGGEDFDNRIAEYLSQQFTKQTKKRIVKGSKSWQRLKEQAERSKCELSSANESYISLPYLAGDSNLELTLTKNVLDNLTREIAKRTEKPCLKCLKDAGLRSKDITDVVLIGGMTRMPLIRQTVRNIFNKLPNSSVNPDEAVAIGAAMQASVLEGKKKDIILVDVTPLTLGIETFGGIMTPIITRNTTIPTRVTKEFTTASDNQTEVDIKVFQGERKLSKMNKKLGEFKLVGIPLAKKGIPKIDVTFDIDVNGIVKVSAYDKGTGHKRSISVKSNGGLSEEEIQKLIKEGEQYKKIDEAKERVFQLKNELRGICDNIDGMKNKLKEKKIDSNNLMRLYNEAKQSIQNEIITNEQLKNVINKLSEEMTKVSSELYK